MASQRFSSVLTACALLVILAGSFVATAQESRGRITGRVSDPQGAVIPAAELVARNELTGVIFKAPSNEAGLYALVFLPPGSYLVTATAPGFKTYQRRGVTVATADEIGLDIVMQVGEIAETITVSADAPMLESTNSTVGQSVGGRAVEEMPLAGRRAMELVKLAANVVVIRTGADDGTPQFSIAGGRVRNQMFWLDGGSNQNIRLGIGGVGADPPVDMIQEFRILHNNYSAEFGGSAGGVVISSTKSGTNSLHGSVYEFLRNDALNGADFFAPTSGTRKLKAPLRQNLFGFTAGGPVIRNRTHFFGGYEGTRRRNGTSEILTLPSLLQRQGDFSQTLNTRGAVIPIYDPLGSRQPFAGNIIPASRIDPIANQFVEFWPLPNRAPTNVAGAQNFTGNRNQIYTRNNYMGRVDHTFSNANRMYFRFFLNYEPSSFSTIYPSIEADPNASLTDAFNENYLWTDTHTFTPNLVMDARYSFGNKKWHNYNAGVGSKVLDRIQLKGVPKGAFPAMNPAGMSAIGNPNERNQSPVRSNSFVNGWTWIRGSHMVKFGADIRKSSNVDLNRPSIAGTFTFATTGTGLPGNTNTGFGYATFLTGFVNSVSVRDTDVLDRYSWYLGGYLQDDWRITPTLTLNIGLRWETDTPMMDRNNRMNSFDQRAVNPVSGTLGVVRFSGADGWPAAPYDTDWNNFGPRFGFAWRPRGTDTWVLRGGYGVFYEHPFASGVPNVASSGFETAAALSSPDNGVTAAAYLNQGIQVTLKPSVRDASFGAVALGKAPTTNVAFFERNRRTGYSQQFNFGVQRQLPWEIIAEVTYLGSLNRKVPNQTMTINQVPTSRLGPGNAQALRPFPQFNGVDILVPASGVNNYHSGMLKMERRFSHGLSLLANFTWARNIGNVNEAVGTDLGDNQNVQDQYNGRLDKGPLAIDIVRRVSFSSVWDVPAGKGRRWLRQGPLATLIGGWTIGSIMGLQSGGPFTVVTQTNTTNAFSAGGQRANVLRDGNLPSGQRTVERWFDTDAFVAPAPYTFGNAGRGILRADGRAVFDFSINKSFVFGEGRYLQFRGDMLNAFNHPDFLPPNHSLGSAGFGLVSSASSPRTVQFGLRLVY